ncbi:MAG: hypothetical protein ACMXYG_04110 [Candidatus Woesearchaeota archaeon]
MDKEGVDEMINYSDYVYWNYHLKTYGNSIVISSRILKIFVFIIAALPIGTAWMFPLIPKIKKIKIRY